MFRPNIGLIDPGPLEKLLDGMCFFFFCFVFFFFCCCFFVVVVVVVFFSSYQFRKIIIRYKRTVYNMNVMRQTACLMVNTITVNDLITRRRVGPQTQ